MTNWQSLTLPHLRGKLLQNAPLHQLTWLRVGGPADWLFEPEDEADLQAFLRLFPLICP